MSDPRKPLFAVALGAALLCSSVAAAAGLDGVAKLIESRMADGGPPAVSVAILEKGKPVFVRAFGSAEIEHNAAARPETVFPIASITKTFTALAILLLQEDGKLKTSDPLSRFMPDYPNAQGITIRNLLTHTSGIPEFTTLEPFASQQALDWTPQQLVALFAKAPPVFAPGAQCIYSDSGYILLGLVIEKVSGQSFGDFVRDRITRPLGMTTAAQESGTRIVPHRASGYARAATGLQNAEYVSMTAPYSAGGMMATASDLAKLSDGMKPGRLISAKSYEEMVAPVVLNDGSACQLPPLPGATGTYGYGLEIVHFDEIANHRAIGKTGVIPGFSGYFTTFEGTDLAIALLSNQDGSLPFSVMLTRDIAHEILGAAR
jgi:D-alanyl-D-alanine carboxypeptidase